MINTSTSILSRLIVSLSIASRLIVSLLTVSLFIDGSHFIVKILLLGLTSAGINRVQREAGEKITPRGELKGELERYLLEIIDVTNSLLFVLYLPLHHSSLHPR